MKLSEGVVKTIVNGGHVVPPFVLQILHYRAVGLVYTLTLSDGVHCGTLCLLSPELSLLMRNEDLTLNTVICIRDYSPTNFPGRPGTFKMFVITDIEILAPGFPEGKRIGEPQLIPKSEEAPKTNLPQLSKGSLSAMMKGNRVDSPIMQVCDYKYFERDQNHGITLSDSRNIYACYVILAGNLLPMLMLPDGQFNLFSVICIKDYVNRPVKDAVGVTRVVLFILDIKVLVPGSNVGKVIGMPEPLAPEALPDTVSVEDASIPFSKESECSRNKKLCRCQCQGCTEFFQPYVAEAARAFDQLLRGGLVLSLPVQDWVAPMSVLRGRGEGPNRLDCQPPSLPPY